MSKKKIVIILLVLCVLIAVIPLAMNRDSEFGGADGQVEEIILEINPEYEAWASPVMEPPGGETESLLFCLQAALGAGVFGYGLGVLRERSRKEKASL
ncbi:energy-coupling factor ABC transporter substrate-binding protein [Anaerosporobacter sp.]|uniref:energy-coupling factor ABC transporter substrate-binding protein n=1 Tax=Anaerosporobacter sp. TaxID=1872529 RepID=UPI002F3E3CFD